MAHLSPTRRLRRRERARRRQFLAGAILTTLLLALSLFQLSRTPPPAGPLDAAAATNGPLVLTTVALEAGGEADPERLTYPYSIIQGGAQSAGALQAAIDKDPVVRQHYANFNVAQTRVVRLTQPRVAHVSYRIGDDVFWTRRPLLLKAGETILTDGTHYARTRCGNQIAMSPGAVSTSEPSAEVLNTPLPRVTGAFAAYPLPGGARVGGGRGGDGSFAASDPGALFPGVAFPSGGSLGPRGGAAAVAGGGSAVVDDPFTGDPGSSSSAGGGMSSGPPPPGGDPRSNPNDPRFTPNDPRSTPDDPREPPHDPNQGDPASDPPPVRNDVKQIPEPAVLLLVGAGGAALFKQVRARRLRAAAANG